MQYMRTARWKSKQQYHYLIDYPATAFTDWKHRSLYMQHKQYIQRILSIDMQKIQIIVNKHDGSEQIKKLEARFPNKNNQLWFKTRYWYPFGLRVGIQVTY